MNKKAISKANKGNNHSNKENRMPTERLKMELKQNPEKVKKIIQALIDKAISGDMAAIREVFDRVDGKVAQQNNINGEMNHNDNYTIKVITGIDDGDDEDDEGILVESPNLRNEIAVEFVDAPPREELVIVSKIDVKD